jgi:AcrR family transcriptional regulator
MVDASPDRKDQIINAAEQLLRRYGLAKTTVVDVAKSLGLSHAAVYKYFADKATLREAVAERWLARISKPLRKVVDSDAEPEAKLRTWLQTLFTLKRKKVLDDPELFSTYHQLAEMSEGAVAHHVAELEAQVAAILAEGAQRGAFEVSKPDASARAVLNATMRFHHPHSVLLESHKAPKAEVEAVIDLVLAGLKRAS